MGGQRAEDERDGAGVGLGEAGVMRGGRFVADEVAGGGVAGGVGGGVGARTAARTGTATEVELEVELEGGVETEAADAAAAGMPNAPTVPAVPAVPAAASEPGSVADADKATAAKSADPLPAQATEQSDQASRPGQADPAAGADQPDPTDLTDSQIVGRRLALARQHAGLSVEDVVAATRIRPGMLREIEAGEFIHCGGDVYARGHVRAIAKVVGIDPEPLLAEHPPFVPTDLPVRGRSRVVPRSELTKSGAAEDREKNDGADKRKSASTSSAVPTSAARDNAARFAGRAPSRVIRPAAEGATLGTATKNTGKGGDGPKTISVKGTGVIGGSGSGSGGGSATVRPPQARRKNNAGKIERNPKSANWTAAMLVALLGLVVFAGVQLLDGSGSGKTAATATPVAPAPKPAPVKPAAPVPPPAPKGVAVKIAAVGSDSWLYVTGPDGKVLFDKLLPSGATQSFQDPKQLGVTLGNAAAVHMTLNGKDLAPAGGTGQVVHVTLNPTGMTAG